MNGVYSPAVDSLDVVSSTSTSSQVLNMVYAGGSSSGGFYPDGMNGNIRTK